MEPGRCLFYYVAVLPLSPRVSMDEYDVMLEEVPTLSITNVLNLLCKYIIPTRETTLVIMTVQQVLHDIIFSPLLTIYHLVQILLDNVFSPTPPPPTQKPGKRNIAVIGAGLTGVSAASHCVGHGFDVKIFEAGDRKAVGGIWAVSHMTVCSQSQL